MLYLGGRRSFARPMLSRIERFCPMCRICCFFIVGCWGLAGFAYGQEGAVWLELETQMLDYGELDPEIEPPPQALLVRVHGAEPWRLELLPSPGRAGETGALIPLDRLAWRLGRTGRFLPLDASGPVELASGTAPGADGTLVLIELALALEEDDPTGTYAFDLRLLALPAADGAQAAMPPPGTTNDVVVHVAAQNAGRFECSIAVPTFDFGTVDISGADFGTPGVVARGRNPANTGGLYENAAGSVEWTCRAAPRSTVDIALVATAADHTGGMYADDLEVRIPTSTRGGVTTGYQPFTSQALLISGMQVKNGNNAAFGNLDLRLTVLDTDPVGANTWVVRLRATGNP